MYELNTILYGPPGTGKTYETKEAAVRISCGDIFVDYILNYAKKSKAAINEIYRILVENNRIAFTTFHQSYGYEEFIEGIKPVFVENEGSKSLSYEPCDGVFKRFCIQNETVEGEQIKACEEAIKNFESEHIISKELKKSNIFKTIIEQLQNGGTTIWMYKKHQKYSDNFDDGIKKGFIKWESNDSYDEKKIASVNNFCHKVSINDIVIANDDKKMVAIGYFDSDCHRGHNLYIRSVKWLKLKEPIDISGIEEYDRLFYNLTSEDNINRAKDIIGKTKTTSFSDDKITIVNKINFSNRVFIIDEINRGNISKIFGELITLIEEDKRAGQDNEISVVLPYSNERFCVPSNVYILGTMNTADRSISMLDIALRRRFNFAERMPDSRLLKDVVIENVDIAKLLDTINERIECLYDREHQIGHAFFMGLNSNSSIDDLAKIFKNKIFPLLQEYFYDDYEKIRLVFGDGEKSENYQLVKKIESEIFDDEDLNEDRFELNDQAFYNAESYRLIYQ